MCHTSIMVNIVITIHLFKFFTECLWHAHLVQTWHTVIGRLPYSLPFLALTVWKGRQVIDEQITEGYR